MKLYEWAAKDILKRRYGIPVPDAHRVQTPDEARVAAEDLGGAVVVKSQILSGGRGKAGGIRFAASPDEAHGLSLDLLGQRIRGLEVRDLLVERRLDIRDHLYLGLAVDGSARLPLLIFSTRGGVDIEEVPDREIFRRPLNLEEAQRPGFWPKLMAEAAEGRGLSAGVVAKVAGVAEALYRAFVENDAELLEINPLAVTPEGEVWAVDARMTVDDDALWRHPELPRFEEGTPLEQRVKALGLSFVELDGDIAVMANGAGITMATIDVLARFGGRAANFLDAGGGAGVEATAAAIEVLLGTRPRAILINIFGGIARCDDVARAVVQVKEQKGIPVPLVVRLAGTNQEQGVEILRQAGLMAYQTMEEAARAAVAAARGG
ncbi:MAG: ADP-forming succinate--CoA ligase subunit beta [Acetobacteraceae bacterium]|nr:ADP-forming succinate--CoA ligase subunit beta [Acetobacteraceae bacterium]